MSNIYTPVKTGNTRVFLIEGRARVDHVPTYESSLRMGSLSQSFGDIEKIEVPDPLRYNKYKEVGQTRGQEERATTSLEGRYALDLLSTLLRLAKKGCSVDVQLHMGDCSDPSVFDSFTKALVLEDASITSYGTDELGSLSSGDEAPVNENVEISAKTIYEIIQLSFTTKAGSIVTNEIVDGINCSSVSCGSCGDEDGGCDLIILITTSAGGSPSTSADVVYSIDKGINWYAFDIDSLLTAEAPNGVACLGTYVVVVSNASVSLHYAEKDEFDGITDMTWTEVTTGFVAGGAPNDIVVKDNVAFIVGNGGYIYSTSDPTAGVTVLDAGSVTTDNLNAVDAISSTFAVSVGNSGAVLYTQDGTIWSAANRPVGAGIHLISVAVKNELEWWVGTSTGRLYYTLDGGTTWTQKTFSGSGSGTLDSIAFASDSVMYVSHTTSAPRGRVLRSYNGGQSFVILPEGVGTLPVADRFNVVIPCVNDVNHVVAAGLNDDASDGIVIVGGAS